MLNIVCEANLTDIVNILKRQLDNYWKSMYDISIISNEIEDTMALVHECLSHSADTRLNAEGNVMFSPMHTSCWCIFLYYLSNVLGKKGHVREATVVYYLNKVMHSVDWFYEIELPSHFMAIHPLGSVLGRAKYGDFLFVYQGTTVGGNWKDDKIYYPVLGDNIIMYANSGIIGKSVIGDNVILAADSLVLNQEIPSNCIVYGKAPYNTIKTVDKDYFERKKKNYWL